MQEKFLPVTTKKNFVERYERGEFGNRSPTWHTLQQWQASGYLGSMHLRSRTAGAPTWYDVPAAAVERKYRELNASSTTHYLSAMAPTQLTLFQGEVQRTPAGLYLYYTTVARPMRQALATGGRSSTGIMAKQLLKYFLCSNSFDWLQVLLDRYDNHIVEFSTYRRPWGTLPHFNTVFWEVRNY